MLKNELWTRRIYTKAEVIVFRGNQVLEETTLLDEIQRNSIREQKVQKELGKDDEQV